MGRAIAACLINDDEYDEYDDHSDVFYKNIGILFKGK